MGSMPSRDRQPIYADDRMFRLEDRTIAADMDIERLKRRLAVVESQSERAMKKIAALEKMVESLIKPRITFDPTNDDPESFKAVVNERVQELVR